MNSSPSSRRRRTSARLLVAAGLTAASASAFAAPSALAFTATLPFSAVCWDGDYGRIVTGTATILNPGAGAQGKPYSVQLTATVKFAETWLASYEGVPKFVTLPAVNVGGTSKQTATENVRAIEDGAQPAGTPLTVSSTGPMDAGIVGSNAGLIYLSLGSFKVGFKGTYTPEGGTPVEVDREYPCAVPTPDPDPHTGEGVFFGTLPVAHINPTPTPTPTLPPPTPTPSPTPTPAPSPTPGLPLHTPLVSDLKFSNITQTSARVCFGGDLSREGLSYGVSVTDRPSFSTTRGCADLDGLQPGKTYSVTVSGYGGFPQGPADAYRKTADFTALPFAEPSPVRTPLPPTPTPVITPTPKPSTVEQTYILNGNASLKTLTKGSFPLSGVIDAKLDLGTGDFSGQLGLSQSTGNLTALGFLPVVAKVVLLPTDAVTGTLKAGKLSAIAKIRIKLPSVKTLGIELAGGANCQAKQISSVTLNSTQEEFLPLEGGPIAGTFAISNLTGCGFLTGLVSPLTQGSGNTIALNLIPAPLSPRIS